MQSEAVKEAVEALRYLNEGENHEAIGKAFEDVWNEHGAALLTLVGEKAEWFKCEVCEKHLPTEIGLQRHRRYHSEATQSPASAAEVVTVKEVLEKHFSDWTGDALDDARDVLDILRIYSNGVKVVAYNPLKSPESE